MNTEDEVLSPELEDRLRRGLILLAEETPAPGAARRKRYGRLQAATLGAAAALAVVLAGPALVGGMGSSGQDDVASSEAAGPMAAGGESAPMTDTFAGAATGDDAAAKSTADGDVREESAEALGGPMEVPPAPTSPENYGRNADETAQTSRLAAYDLPMLVEQSQRIVVGKVAEVTERPASGASGGLPYVLATLEVEDALRGPAGRVVAFDYAYDENSIAAGAPQGASFAVGERVLVFLSDTSGTVHHGVSPEHWQVTGGSQGKFTMNGPEPEADFTLDGVRAEIERQGR